MKKAFGQTVRDLKRGVNKKVLKVPGIEQKVLDATSNESWGPHGSLLADIAHASRNYHEYQLTMGVLWKRLSDTGKNWRHVYKALTVLEYMVAHGSERVIEEIKERAYQISTLVDFQYIDSSGKDQGSNVRKKSQSLVALVNDKERISEVREKAATNKDRYRNSTVGGMNRPSGGYGDKYDYEGRDEGRSSYGGDKEFDDRNSRDGDRYSRDSEDRYEDRGRSKSVDNFQNGSRGRSSDREQRSVEDDGQSQDGGIRRNFSEQNIGASPPSYEEAVNESRSPVYSERDGGETPQVTPPQDASLPVETSIVDNSNNAAGFVNESSPQQVVETFDEFDPRGSVVTSAPSPVVATTSAPPVASNTEMDLLGSLSDVFSPNPLAIVSSDSVSVETNGQENSFPPPSFSTTSHSSTQPFDDPFGDSPFKAVTSTDTDSSLHQSFGAPFQASSNPDFGFGESFTAVPNLEPGLHNMLATPDSFPQENFDTSESEIDILAGILPPSGPSVSLSQPNPTNGNMYESFNPPAAPTDLNMSGQTPFGQASQQYNTAPHSQNLPGGMQVSNGGGFMQQQQPGYAGSANPQPPQYTSHPTIESFPHQPGFTASSSSQAPQGGQFDGGNFMPHQAHGVPSHIQQHTHSGPVASPNAQAGQFDGGNFMAQQVHNVPSHIQQHTHSAPVESPGNSSNNMGDMFAPAGQFGGGNFMAQQAHGASQQIHSVPSHMPQRTQSVGPLAAPENNNSVGDMFAPPGQFGVGGGSFMTQQPHGVTQQVHGVPPHMPQRTQSGPVASPRNNSNTVGDMFAPAGQFDNGSFMPQQVHGVPQRTQSAGPVAVPGNNNYNGDMFATGGLSSLGTSASQPSLTPLTGAIEIVPPQTQKKFEPKSTIWADTLSRGLVNFNISGPKTNPLADIGVDFEAINRKEKRLEKPTAAQQQQQQQQVTSTINMGKAMGSGTGLGRAGAGSMRPPTNTMPGPNMAMGGYGGMNQTQPMGMNPNYHPMGMNQNYPMGMGNMNQNHQVGMGGGYGQGYSMQQQQGMMPMAAPGQPPQEMNGVYNPMMGQGGYNNPQQQQPYGGGYR